MYSSQQQTGKIKISKLQALLPLVAQSRKITEVCARPTPKSSPTPKPISGRVDRAFATEAVDLGSIPGRVKPKTIKIGIHSFLAWRSAIKGTVVIVITFYSPSCLGQETAKGPFGLRVKLPPAHLSTTHGGGFTQSLWLLNVKQGSCEYQFL